MGSNEPPVEWVKAGAKVSGVCEHCKTRGRVHPYLPVIRLAYLAPFRYFCDDDCCSRRAGPVWRRTR